jgi:hypothetical protein
MSSNQIHAEQRMSTRLALMHTGSYRWFARKHVRVTSALLAAVAIAFAMPSIGGQSGTPNTGNVTAQEPMVGQFTGKLINGAPVYRLPPIRVSVSRKAELARIEREERLTHVSAAKARTAGRPPA